MRRSIGSQVHYVELLVSHFPSLRGSSQAGRRSSRPFVALPQTKTQGCKTHFRHRPFEGRG